VKLWDLMNFGGGLTLMPISCKQPQNHLDVSARVVPVFLAGRKS
jgi:hypothetical protein